MAQSITIQLTREASLLYWEKKVVMFYDLY